MSDLQRLSTILIATNNPGKAREIEAVLSEGHVETLGNEHPVARMDGGTQPGPEHADLGGRHGPPARRESSGESMVDAAIDHREPTHERVGHPAHIDGVKWVTLRDLEAEIPEPVEDQDSFAGNSLLKAVYYSKASGLVTLADDSGLEVDALGGAPGVYSARYADVDGDPARAERDLANNLKLIAALAGVPELARTARFRCVLTLADGDRVLAQASGAIEGRIIDVPRGDGGFGYDPHFLVPELGKTTAELPAEHKNRISHRGVALRLLRGMLFQIQKSQN